MMLRVILVTNMRQHFPIYGNVTLNLQIKAIVRFQMTSSRKFEGIT